MKDMKDELCKLTSSDYGYDIMWSEERKVFPIYLQDQQIAEVKMYEEPDAHSVIFKDSDTFAYVNLKADEYPSVQSTLKFIHDSRVNLGLE
jgi:hypothetical protein